MAVPPESASPAKVELAPLAGTEGSVDHETLRFLVDNMTDAVVTADARGQIVAGNAAATRWLPARDRLLPLLLRSLQGEAVEHEAVLVPSPGGDVWLDVSARPVFNATGAICGALGILQETAKPRELLDAVLEQGPCEIAIVDAEARRFSWTNQRLVDHFGDPFRGGLAGVSIEETIPGFEKSGYAARFRRVAETGIALHADVEYADRNRKTRYCRYSVIRISGSGGAYRLLVVAVELTQQVESLRHAVADLRQLQAILSGLSEGLAIAEPSGKILYINTAAARILGYDSPDEMSRDLPSFASVFDVFHLDGTPVRPRDRALERALRGHTLSNYELRFVRRDTGLERIVSYSASPIKEQGAVILGAVVLRDVTEQKRADRERADLLKRERAARALAEEAQRWYRNLADTIPQMVWTAGPGGQTDYVNRHWFEYTGEGPEETYGREWFSTLHPDDLKSSLQRWKQCLETGETLEAEYRFRRGRDGAHRWHLVRALPMRSDEGRIVKWFGTCTDIHEQKETQARLAHALAELRRTELRLRRIADSNLVGIGFWKKDGTITEANDEYLRLLGFTRDDLDRGRANWNHVSPREHQTADNAAWMELYANGIATPYEKEFIHTGGKRIPVLIGLAALDAQVEEGLAFVLDLSERKKAELDLKQSNQDLQQFAFVASHDLQEPLRMVTSYSQLLARRYEGRLDQDADEYIGYISDGSRRMSSLIQDLLAFSRLGFTEMKPSQPTPASAIVEWALMNLQLAIQESGARVSWGELPVISVDQTQMVQLFQNLIGNAIKYRGIQPPEIRIEAQRSEDDWQITVRDNGIGFDPVYADQIFGVFKRLHGREVPGTGIGLAICKRIVERHGGRIWATATPGSGATFSFTLPAED